MITQDALVHGGLGLIIRRNHDADHKLGGYDVYA